MTQHGAASAGATCPACGVETPAAARFCPACGQRLLGGVEERRVVTVLFADLVDSTRLVEALDHAAHALGLAGLAGTGPEDQAELRLERGTVRGATGDLPGALADLGPATGSARPAVRARAWTELSNLHGSFGQFAESAAAADHAIVEAVKAGDPALIAQATRAKAYVPYLDGDLTGAGRLLDEAAQVTLGELAWLQDDLDTAEEHFAEGNRLSLEVGYTRKRLWSLLGLTQVAIARGRPEAARRLASEAITLTTQPDGTADVEAELHLAEACLADADLGEAAVARAWAVLQEVDVFSRARLQRTEARLAAASGDPAGAVALLERALDQATMMGANALVRRLAGAEVPGRAGSRQGGEMGR